MLRCGSNKRDYERWNVGTEYSSIVGYPKLQQGPSPVRLHSSTLRGKEQWRVEARIHTCIIPIIIDTAIASESKDIICKQGTRLRRRQKNMQDAYNRLSFFESRFFEYSNESSSYLLHY